MMLNLLSLKMTVTYLLIIDVHAASYKHSLKSAVLVVCL